MNSAAGWCRRCFNPVSGQDRACPTCGSRRLVRHAEASTLSIAHIDCDAFYAAIEKRDNPSLEDQPVIIGGGRRGVVSTACYVARLYGVKSAMPMFKALKLCPDAVVLRPRMNVYASEGRRIREMMQDVTPAVEPLSIDEAFLDLTGTQRLHGAAPALTLIKLQSRVREEVGVTVSVGLSFNKFLAKTASDLDKPDGFALIGEAEARAFLSPRPVGSVYGVGPVFAKKLEREGLKTLSDVIKAGEHAMIKRHGETGQRLWRLAQGIDTRPVNPERERKSVSAETTFDTDISNLDELENRLWPLCVKVADRMKDSTIAGRVVTLKLKTADFRTLTRRRTLPDSAQLADTLFRHAREMLAREKPGQRYRLIGAGYSELEPAHGDAGDLLDPNASRRAAAERAMDAARQKFGSAAVQKGRMLKRDP
ncbi:DNA polymerase IV [Marinicauda pacifica]|uniref:DNA polymerase IV n=1 Tax=Marinicauda pacifica TaxID=1133559 RepID=A0A4S2H8Z8_9PROT|nr:DNA polymerase IV [Marinicauda pacifica]TGY91862.1 DNA polymerase IV [Marinicauda pacifica]GGE50169.1 DNA polymerase IV [Marinicauda pacifica]